MYSSYERFERTVNLIGEENFALLQKSRVAVFGLGGVGGYAVEALVRSGIGSLVLIDFDTVSLTNLNRQIIATESTIGKKKTEVISERAKSINPEVEIIAISEFVNEENIKQLLSDTRPDYIIDAIDTVASKVALIDTAQRMEIPIVSCMGTGNKLDPAAFRIVDISKTDTCPLARIMRKKLLEKGIKHVDVLYSSEKPSSARQPNEENGRHIPSSIAFVPSVAGLMLGGYVINKLMNL